MKQISYSELLKAWAVFCLCCIGYVVFIVKPILTIVL